MSTPITIRTAGEKELSEVSRLAEAIWPAAYGNILSEKQIAYMLERFYSPASLDAAYSSGHHFLLAVDEEKKIGFAGYELGHPEADSAKLHKLYVLHTLQRGGVGSLLLDTVIKECRHAGIKYLWLNVNRYNAARAFYERKGFSVVYEEDIDIGNGYYMNDFVMRLLV